MSSNGTADAAPKKKDPVKITEIEKIYQKKSQLEHILLRPDTYIGSVEHVKESMWLFDEESNTMSQREISYVPGLYKIFDEILVNAADNKQRCPSMDTIKIDISAENNTISVWNNGTGIPVVMHKEEKMYIPTMIFGHLLTSSNYNDEEEKVTGGRNGYGAKLCNIFSNKFTVETACGEYHKMFKQVWGDNMGKTSTPSIKEFKGNDYTKVIFSPDLKKFNMEKLDKDIIDLMSRRAYDIAASTKGVKVFLNGKKVAVKNFKDYVDLYLKKKLDDQERPLKIVYESVNDRWEVAVAMSNEGKGFQQVSFVNSIATTKGGRHVDHVVDAIIKNLIEIIKKKNKNNSVKPFQVKSNLWVFVNCLIVNPTFDSQTKENMTLMMKSFGSKCTLNEAFMKKVAGCGIVELVLTWAKFKEEAAKQKVGGTKKTKISSLPKLEDANHAGSNKSLDCTLILTEGDSAKTLAVSGLSIIGRDKYGVFPLKGKILNVRDAGHKQIMENAEVNNIIKIMGLQYKRQYNSDEDLKSLRYGRLMIMTDQDQDGSHIKGLLINFLHANWPSLLKIPFLEQFITPIVKASKKNESLPFYSLPEFEEWKQATDNWTTYSIKYYKGLGTSTSKEAKEYFSDMKRHRIRFKYGGPDDDHHIKLAFSKACIEQRKDWLTGWMQDTKQRREIGLNEQYLYEKNTTSVTYTEFVNKELVLFSNGDNARSIPSMMDGLKPGQRKVLFTCLLRNDKKEVKVAQLAGSVGEKSAYHHGEASLMGTIINLAQNYVGSNNINLLQPIGQFGTRLAGGKDAASPRYIFTKLSPLTKLIYHSADTPLLQAQYDDGQKIEPLWYCPIIPMVLVNGADGIGTGWMTKIQNYNPRQIIENIHLMIDGKEPKAMLPWYKNFLGTIEELGDTRYIVYGEIAVLKESEGMVEITELPVGVWTQKYKEDVLEPMSSSVKGPALITDYKEYNTDTTVRFVVTMPPQNLKDAEMKEGLHKYFKLMTSMANTSMCVFDNNQCMKRYDNVLDILRDFFKVRLDLYEKRKAYLEGMLEAEALLLSNRARFIIEKCDGTLVVENKKRQAMVDELVKMKYDPDPVKAWKLRIDREGVLAEQAAEAIDEDSSQLSQEEAEDTQVHMYGYLLGMTMWSLTLERKNAIIKERDEKRHELKVLQAKTPGMLWREDLAALSDELDAVEKKECDDEKGTSKAKDKSQDKKKGPQKKVVARETMPSPSARKVAATMSSETRKKFMALGVKPKNEGGAAPKKKAGRAGSVEKDEFDLMGEKAIRPLQDRIGKSPEMIEKKLVAKRKEKEEKGMKQTKLPFKTKPPSKAKSPAKAKSPKKRPGKADWETDSEEEVNSDNSMSSVTTSPVPVRQVARRTAAAKVKFTHDDSESENSAFSEPELQDIVNGSAGGPVVDDALDEDSPPSNKRKLGDDGTDSDSSAVMPAKKPAPAKRKPVAKLNPSVDPNSINPKFDILRTSSRSPDEVDVSYDAMFDSLVGASSKSNGTEAIDVSSDESQKKPVSKPPAKKRPLMKENTSKPKPAKKAAAPKKRVNSDSDSDDMFTKKKTSKPPKSKKKANSSDSDESVKFSDSDSDSKPKAAPVKTVSARARKPMSYKFDEDSESD